MRSAPNSSAETLAQLEDIYLPYRPKRRTKATIAREKGLSAAHYVFDNQNANDTAEQALQYVDADKEVADGRPHLKVHATSSPSGSATMPARAMRCALCSGSTAP